MIFRSLSECEDNTIWPINNSDMVSNRCHRLGNPSHSTILYCTSSLLNLKMDNSPSNFVAFKALCSRYSSRQIDLAKNLHPYSPSYKSDGAYQLYWICYLDIQTIVACFLSTFIPERKQSEYTTYEETSYSNFIIRKYDPVRSDKEISYRHTSKIAAVSLFR